MGTGRDVVARVGEGVSMYEPFRVIPKPGEAIVHERKKPSVPFGFRKGSSVDWEPAGPERRTRDEETVEWARRMRQDP